MYVDHDVSHTSQSSFGEPGVSMYGGGSLPIAGVVMTLAFSFSLVDVIFSRQMLCSHFPYPITFYSRIQGLELLLR